MYTKYNIYYYTTIEEKFIILKEKYKDIADINLIDINLVDNVKLKNINDMLRLYNDSLPMYELETDIFIETAAMGENSYRILELDLIYESNKLTNKLNEQ